MTPASISEVTGKRTNLLVWGLCMSNHTVPCQPVRAEREALPAEKCPRCHGLVSEVTDSVCECVWQGNNTAERSRGRSSWPFVYQGLSLSVHLTTTLKELVFLSPWQVRVHAGLACVYLKVCKCVHLLWPALKWALCRDATLNCLILFHHSGKKCLLEPSKLWNTINHFTQKNSDRSHSLPVYLSCKRTQRKVRMP